MKAETAEELRSELRLCIYHPRLKKYFEEYTKSISSSELIKFVREIDDFRITFEEHLRKEKFKQIEKDFLLDDSPFAVHVEASLKAALKAQEETAPVTAFDDSQESVLLLMQNDIFPKFVKSPFYQSYQEENGTLSQKDLAIQISLAGVPRVLDFSVLEGRNLTNKGKEVDNVTVKTKLFGLLEPAESLHQLDEQMRVELGRKKSKTIKKNANPVWNEDYIFLIEHQNTIPYLVCEVCTKDSFFQETVIGSIMISVAEIDTMDRWVPIKKSGEIHLKMNKRM